MPQETPPEFELSAPALSEPPRNRAQRDDRVLNLRGFKIEHFYQQWKTQEQAAKQVEASLQKAQTTHLMELVQLADSFEDVHRQCAEDKKMKKQAAVRDAFQMTYDLLLEMLESHGAHRVSVIGKRYDEIKYENTPIPEPWTVVGKSGKASDTSRTVSKVIRSLWVCKMNGRLFILRRGQVMY